MLPFDHKIKATFQFLTVSVVVSIYCDLQSNLQANQNPPQLEFDRLKNEKIVTFPTRKTPFSSESKILPFFWTQKNAKSRKKLAENRILEQKMDLLENGKMLKMLKKSWNLVVYRFCFCLSFVFETKKDAFSNQKVIIEEIGVFSSSKTGASTAHFIYFRQFTFYKTRLLRKKAFFRNIFQKSNIK